MLDADLKIEHPLFGYRYIKMLFKALKNEHAAHMAACFFKIFTTNYSKIPESI